MLFSVSGKRPRGFGEFHTLGSLIAEQRRHTSDNDDTLATNLYLFKVIMMWYQDNLYYYKEVYIHGHSVQTRDLGSQKWNRLIEYWIEPDIIGCAVSLYWMDELF